MVRWDVLATTCCSFMRGSTLGSSVYTARSYCLMGVCWASVPFQSWDQNPRGTLSFCSTQPILSRVTGISNLYGRPAWEKPRTLICFTNTWFCCFNPQSRICPLLTRWSKALCWVGNKSPPNPPSPYKGLQFFHVPRGWKGLYLINHTFWVNACLTQPNDSQKCYSAA